MYGRVAASVCLSRYGAVRGCAGGSPGHLGSPSVWQSGGAGAGAAARATPVPATGDQPGGEAAASAQGDGATAARWRPGKAQSAAAAADGGAIQWRRRPSCPLWLKAPPSASFTGQLRHVGSDRGAAVYRGLEPALGLVYDSSGGAGAADADAGFVGVGWRLSGFPDIVRTQRIGGMPRFDGSDVFVLAGQELLPCADTEPNASCAAGGNHTTRSESGRKIVRDPTANTWTVYAPDGTRVDLQAGGDLGR